jgi:hypothetical protein
VLAAGLRLVLLLAVLIQYAPMRHCAVERVALGSNCHDVLLDRSPGDGHADEWACGTGTGRDAGCLCEQPKGAVGAPAHHAAAAVPDRTDVLVRVGVVEEPASHIAAAAPDPDPQRDLLASLQLPLLI